MRVWRTRFACSLLIVLFAFIPATRGAPPASGELRCAFIDIDQSPLGGLVEAELLTRPEVEWLERTEIQKLIAERQLQPLLAATAGNDRTALGQVLKADVLVILKTTTQNDQSFGELVVAETRSGLRLVSQRLPLSRDLQETATLAAKLVDGGISKAGKGVKHVFAIPPFLSNDLTYEFDYLRSTYAKLLEQSLLDADDVVVVELEEANAVAKELRLTSADGSVRRNLPIYLMGEYRNEAEGDQRTVRLSLRIQQGDKELDSQQVEIRADKVPDFLRKSARKIAKSQGIETPPSDPTAEARQLNNRAKQFIRLANWQEALGLIEASLLLLPDQPETLSDAILVAGHRAKQFDRQKLDQLEKAKELNRRSIEHLRTLATNHSVEACQPHFDLLSFSDSNHLPRHHAGSALSERLAELEEVYSREKRQLAIELSHRLAAKHDWESSALLLSPVVDIMTPERRYNKITKMILQYQDGPDPNLMVRSYSHGGYKVDKLRTLEGRRFLEQLRKNPEANDDVKHTAENLLAAIGTLPQPQEAETGAVPQAESRLTFKPIDLTYHDEQLGRTLPLKMIDGCLPLKGGTDVFYSSQGVFVLSPQRELRQLWSPPVNSGVQSISFDGRYLWLAVLVAREAPEIWVFDFQNGQSVQLTALDGLPLLSQDEIPNNISARPSVSLATVEPGRAIVAGYIGKTWLADVRFDPQGNHQIKIFHEAKEIIPPGTKEADWRNIDLAFHPVGMRTFSSGSELGEPKKVVMICRSSFVSAVKQHALLVNPEDLSVRVAEKPWLNQSSGRDSMNMLHGSYYYTGPTPPKFDSIGLIRFGMTEFEPEVMIPSIHEGHVLINQQQEMVNVVGIDWHRGRLGDGELESFGPVPWVYSNHWRVSKTSSTIRFERGSFQLRVLADSNHFGSILSCREIEGPFGIAQVVFDGSGVSLKEALKITKSETKRVVSPRPDIQPRAFQPKNLWQDRVRCSALAYSPDGSFIVTTSRSPDEMVQVWDGESGQLTSNLQAGPEGMTAVAFSHDGKLFATGGTAGRVILWDADAMTPIGEFKGLTKQIEQLVFSWKGDKLGAASEDRAAVVWSVPDGKLLYEVERRHFGIRWLGFTANDSLFLTSSHSTTQAWNATDGSLVGNVESLATVAGVLADRSLVASSNDVDNTLIKWNSADVSSEELWPRMMGVPLAVSRDGKFLVTYTQEMFIENERVAIHRLEVWDLPEKKKLASKDRYTGKHYHFSPSEDALLIVDFQGGFSRLELKSSDVKTDLSP